ncbi:MAG: aminotransferase class V-fold PLP-dependent enzyme [Campylobacteraceae bacterium]|nr:aminotransferase class V-fold PLP-dependent enzyme [Campylobacteraceae bacterium]
MNNLVNKEDFPLTKDIAYVNAANVSLMPLSACDVITSWQKNVAINGCLDFNDVAEETAYDGLRKEGAKLFSCNEKDIAGGSSFSELLNSVAWAIMPQKGQNVVSTQIVFPSTSFSWLRIAAHTSCEMRFVKATDSYVKIDDIIKQIDKNTSVVSISHVEYTGGQVYDLRKLADAAHEHGALLVVDATQSAGAIPIDAPLSGADIIISGAYKWLCGPFGAALMYIKPELQLQLQPGFVGFRSHIDMWDLDPQRLTYAPSARRFESSTMAFGCIKGLEASIKYLTDIGISKIFEYNMVLANKLLEGLNTLDAKIASAQEKEERTSIITCTIKNKDTAYVVNELKKRGVIAHKRQQYIRFSPHLYNNVEDIDKILLSLKEIIK